MNRWFVVIFAALAVVTAATAAQQESGGWCVSWYEDAFDAQQAAQRYALTAGPQSIITLACAAHEYPYLVAHRLPSGTCVTISEPDFGWRVFATVPEAVSEYDLHAVAGARGIVSTVDGKVIVYWTKPMGASR